MGEFGGEIRFDEALARHTYYRIGGPARWVLIPASIEDLQWIRRGLQAEGCAWFILGLGSNILASDIGFAGAVIKTSRLGPQKMEEIDSGRLRTGAGVAISSLLRRASSSGWGGLEFLAGIPGSVGGVVRMNAGTHLGEAKDAIVKVEAYDLNGADADLGLTYEDKDLNFCYRGNQFLPEGAVVTAAEWKFNPESPEAVRARIAETLARRKVTQPIDYPSCGSVFKNPGPTAGDEGLRSAWQVVDRLGLRGHRMVTRRFRLTSNFIINHGAARGGRACAHSTCETRARTELGIELHEEVRFIGSFASS